MHTKVISAIALLSIFASTNSQSYELRSRSTDADPDFEDFFNKVNHGWNDWKQWDSHRGAPHIKHKHESRNANAYPEFDLGSIFGAHAIPSLQNKFKNHGHWHKKQASSPDDRKNKARDLDFELVARHPDAKLDPAQLFHLLERQQWLGKPQQLEQQQRPGAGAPLKTT